MSIFNQRTVVGLFDTEGAAHCAMQALQGAGFGTQGEDEVQVLDRTRLAGGNPAVLPTGRGEQLTGLQAPSGLAGTARDPDLDGESASTDLVAVATELLLARDIGQQESAFLAQRLDRGAVAVLVEAGDVARATVAWRVLEQNGAQAVTS